jgi:hypothetical protein
MKPLLKYVGYVLMLVAIETTLCIVLFLIENVFYSSRFDSWQLSKAIKDGLEVNAVRIIFYFILQLILFIILVRFKKWQQRSLQVAMVNCFIYILLSLIYSGIFSGAAAFFSSDFFFFLTLGTFLSPFILGKKVRLALLE